MKKQEFKSLIKECLLEVLKEVEFDPKELSMGTQEEMEHADDPKVAQSIAMDHLKEDPKYYSKLKKCFPRK